MKKPILLVTPGDPDGIGPEVVWKGISSKHKEWSNLFSILCIGAKDPFIRLGAKVYSTNENQIGSPPEDKDPHIWLLEAPTSSTHFLPGFQSGWSIETATTLIQKKIGAALITGPINKDRLQKGGFSYFGHTDFLASLTQTKKVTMMLANSHARVSLVTTHIPLSRVSQTLSIKAVSETIQQTALALQKNWGITKPNIAVLGLNPHAGENGILGTEENEIISPALLDARQKLGAGPEISGPYPADTFFGVVAKNRRFDAVVCMYHDQGLIPIKLLDFENTVNVTLGLPFVRTSVDHGTAFDIAWKNTADCSSFIAATSLAFDLWRNHDRI